MQLDKASKNSNRPIVTKQIFSRDGKMLTFQMWDGLHFYISRPNSKERENQVTRRNNRINDFLLRSGRSVTRTSPPSLNTLHVDNKDAGIVVVSTYEFPVVQKTFTVEVRLQVTLPAPLCDLVAGDTNLYTPVPSFSPDFDSEYTKQWNLIVDHIMSQMTPEDIDRILIVEETK